MEAFYDLKKSPPTHDFINWLVRVEQERRISGNSFLHIKFVSGLRFQSPRDIAYSKERRDWRVKNLLMPLCWLLPSVTNVSYGMGEQVHSYLNFKRPQEPVLKAPEVAQSIVFNALKDIPNPVSITIRQTHFEKVRNSKISEWAKVAEYLKGKGFTPIIVPDAESDMINEYQKLPYFHYTAAAHNPSLRLALYEQTVINLMTTGGPMLIALFSESPLMAFKLIVPGLQCTTEEHMRKSSMSPEDDWGSYKKLYWEDDLADLIIPRLEERLNFLKDRQKPKITDVFSINENNPVGLANS